MYFCIPKEKFSSQKTRLLYFLGLLILNLLMISVYLNHLIHVSANVVSGAQGYDKKFMIGFIIHRFSWFLDFLFQTIKSQWLIYLYSYIGMLGCVDTPLNPITINGFLLILIFTSLFKTEKKEAVFNLKSKIIFAFIFLTSSLIILTSAFILFQCYPVFCGVQGRYFIPIMPLLFFILDNKKWSFKKLPIFLIAGIIILMPFVFMTLVNRFYI